MVKTARTLAYVILWSVTGVAVVAAAEAPDILPPEDAGIDPARYAFGGLCTMGDAGITEGENRSYRRDAALPPAAANSSSSADGDIDQDGWVGLDDYASLVECMAGAGQTPDPTPPLTAEQCLAAFDTDTDMDVDLIDFGGFQTRLGHVPILLRDTLGSVITIDSTTPYSGRRTCGAGGCHDVDHISNGFKFQQGRTDVDGNVIVRDDFFGDGRWWQRSAGRYGTWLTGQGELAAKQSANESQIHLTTFAWIGACGGCHVGGGPGEFDRDGVRLWDKATGQFGYEVLGKDPGDVVLDGDYSYMDPSGTLSPAPWEITGLVEPDCLFCHTPDPAWDDGQNINRRVWRVAALAAKAELVDDGGNPVPAYAASGPASQGWFSNMEIEGSVATTLQIDYSVGVTDGNLVGNSDDTLSLTRRSIDRPPRDNACWMCHGLVPFNFIRGAAWFDNRDVMYAGLNRLTDDDPSNDVAPEQSTTCVQCHPGGLHHNFAKGNSFVQHFRDELDWVNFRSCRECHLTELANGGPNPLKHPDAPPVPGGVIAHLAGTVDSSMMGTLSCQACHVPYPLLSPVWFVIDRAISGSSTIYMSDQFLSANPLDPSDPDRSRWYPALMPKEDSDGVVRLFPAAILLQVYWGDWDRKGTPDDLSDDTVHPIIQWRLNQLIPEPPPIVTDDNGDGRLEVNRPEEIYAYIQTLKGNDSYGRQVAANPVLVKGDRIWYEDPQAPGGVNSFEHQGTGIIVDWAAGFWGLNHNVLAASESWGAVKPPDYGCEDCHFYPTVISPVFDRKILIDPWGPDGQPVYTTVREMTGVSPP